MNNKLNNMDDKSQKSKHKFNIVDFLIILLVVAIIGTSIYTIVSWSDIKALWSTSSKKFQYVVELRGVDAEFINNIKKNDVVIDAVSKNQLGNVQNIVSEDYSFLNYKNDNGDTIGAMVTDTTKRNLTIYITATAEYEKDVGYTVNGRRIAVGEILELRFPQLASSAYCISIDID